MQNLYQKARAVRGWLALVVLALGLGLPAQAQHPAWAWARAAGTTGVSDDGFGVATDARGNVYTTGVYNTRFAAQFGNNITLPASGNTYDIFVAKYDSTGTCRWAQRIGSTATGSSGSNFGRGIAVDSASNVYVTGYFSGRVNVGSFVLNSLPLGSSDNDVLVVKYDSAGVAQWATRGGGDGLDRGMAIAVRGNFVFVGGWYSSTNTSFGTSSLPTVGTNSNNIFVAALNATSGQWRWARGFGRTSSVNGVAATADAVYAVGYFTDALTIGATTLISGGGRDGFIARFDPVTGAPQWTQQVNGTREEAAFSCATDARGNLYVGGYYSSPVTTLGGAIGTTRTMNRLFTPSGSDLLLVKYAPDGALQWAVGPEYRSGSIYGNGVGVDRAGNVYAGGTLTYSAVVGPDTIQATGNSSVFVARYDGHGRGLSALVNTNVGGGRGVYDQANALAIGPRGDAYLTGSFNNQVIFPPQAPIPSLGEYDIFVAKVSAGCLRPTPLVGANRQACATLTDTLGAPAVAGVTYAWTAVPAAPGFPSTQAQPIVNLTAGAAPVTYTFSVLTSDSSGCTASNDARLTVNPAPAQPTVTQQPTSAGIVNLTSSAPTGNQWYFNGAPIPGATSATYAVTTGPQSGAYSVAVTSPIGCVSLVSAPVTVTVTGLSAEHATELTLHPNPTADGRVTLTLAPLSVGSTLTVLDATGRTVMTRALAAGTHEHPLDLRALPPGLYAVRLVTGPTALVRRLVRE